MFYFHSPSHFCWNRQFPSKLLLLWRGNPTHADVYLALFLNQRQPFPSSTQHFRLSSNLLSALPFDLAPASGSRWCCCVLSSSLEAEGGGEADRGIEEKAWTLPWRCPPERQEQPENTPPLGSLLDPSRDRTGKVIYFTVDLKLFYRNYCQV